MDYNELALDLHKKYQGKIVTTLRDDDLTREKLSAYYTPGVAEVSRTIAEDPSLLPIYTWTNNLVAVISDGSAVLGLGNIGPEGAMPVMEGKALLFKHFAGIDAVPIILNVHTTDEIVSTIKAIAPSFGAINLEDIAAPICFEVEERLKDELTIPIFHDDQHGTAVVVLAGLINALKVTGRDFTDLKIVISGAGAAGVAIAKLLHRYGKDKTGTAPKIIAVDSRGVIHSGRDNLNESKRLLLKYTTGEPGSIHDAIKGADIFIGVSQPGIIAEADIKTMNESPIVFALANPVPEIMPDIAKKAGAAVIATGRTDFANQVNNAIAFPGIFRGALDHKVSRITDDHKIAAAKAIAARIGEPTADNIIPSVFDTDLVQAIADIIR